MARVDPDSHISGGFVLSSSGTEFEFQNCDDPSVEGTKLRSSGSTLVDFESAF